MDEQEGSSSDGVPFHPSSTIVATDRRTNEMQRIARFEPVEAFAHIIYRFPEQNDTQQIAYTCEWMRSHWHDARIILKKPLVLAEFGKSKKDPGYTVHGRDMYMSFIFDNIYRFAMNRGTFGGGLVWQIMAEGMDSYSDGYEIVFSQNQSTTKVITEQSNVMAVLNHHLRPNQQEKNGGEEMKKNKRIKDDDVKT